MGTVLRWLWPVLALPAALAGSPDEAIAGGELELALRYRFEHVDQDSFARDADASTLRARLSYTSGTWRAFRAMVELDAVRTVLVDDFNSGAGTSSARRNVYPVVADPDYEEFNQLYLEFGGLDQTRLRFGRQRILLDNQRFVGGVGWRQNEQTYDGVSVETTALGGAKVFYSYIANVNRIFGDDVAAGDHQNDTHLLDLGYAFNERSRLSGYLYAIDNDDAPAFSTTTFGLRFQGGATLAENQFAYTLEAARQNDAAGNPVDYSASYYNIEGQYDFGPASLLAGYEVLSGSSAAGGAFRTPLATLHAFNGWADRFTTTPDDGLEDLWLGLTAVAGEWSLKGVVHDFSAETGGRDFGHEIDFSAGRKVGENYSLLVKLARFVADDSTQRDTTKVWFMAGAAY